MVPDGKKITGHHLKIVFRTDASFQIGTGHVMRCLTLAHALRDRGCECHFVCRDHPGNLNALILKQGFNVYELPKSVGTVSQPTNKPAHASWLGTDWQTDAKQLQSVIGCMTVDWLVVDHYALGAQWEQKLRSICRKLMVIDDLADRPHDCDLLLDQNLIKNFENRYSTKIPAHCGSLLGPDYALLQPQFAELHDRVPPRVGPIHNILIYFGGADTDNLTGMAISAISSLKAKDITADVVVNPANPHAPTIRHHANENKWLQMHEQLPSLAPLMVKADLAIGAGGATTWERCCLGLPTIVITLAENQVPIAEKLSKINVIKWIGHKDNVNTAILAQELKKIVDTGLPSAWAQRCHDLVSGRGAFKVAEFMLLGSNTRLTARIARLKDEHRLLQWANDPLARKNAFHPQLIEKNTHQKWFYRKLRDLDNCQIFIIETEHGLPIGQVRFEKYTDEWEISYSLDSRARGRKLAKTM
ncbi:MAG: UDP-2,4-diacetamido-2,4,6-trideoxy-beta-L-altropyranose hydrolase, partial [Desulfomicrobium sp.]|nr:UDP-2,4-diacetamido-2,4,6-trideoxy-beta-L-altropyranose hydrolase [Desulfomicrobium sp.]